MTALFTAKHSGGVTEYTSRRTGKKYLLVPSDGGISVECGKELMIWTDKLHSAMTFVEQYDAM